MSNGITPLTPEQIQEQEAATAKEGYLRRALVALDVFANVLTGGKPDETISSRSARAAEHGNPVGIAISKTLDVFEPDHGAKAQAGDLERAEAVEQLEKDSLKELAK